MGAKADVSKVINRMAARIAELEKQNIILTIQLEELVQFEQRMNKIEGESK